MSTAVATCLQCSAKVNIHWKACLVCRAPIEAGAHHEEAYPLHANDGNVPISGCRIRWQRGNLSWVTGTVREVLVDPSANPPVMVLVDTGENEWSVLNPRLMRFELED